jgi:hypothetical protein
MNPPLMPEVQQLTCLVLAYTKQYTVIRKIESLDTGFSAVMTQMKKRAKVSDIARDGLTH